MDSRIDIIKGIHPGTFIERELKKNNLTQHALAEKTNFPYQTSIRELTERKLWRLNFTRRLK